MTNLIARWAATRPSFEQVLQNELESYGKVRQDEYHRIMLELLRDQQEPSRDPLALINLAGHPVMREFIELRRVFEEDGLSEHDAARAVLEFWHWPGNWEQPYHRISAHLFAAVARKVASGQRSVTAGFLNDVNAIGAYAPYVDAMLVDKECANLLREIGGRLDFRARIFSLNTGQEFLTYLGGLEAGTSEPVRKYAERIYRI